ncbi:hypothetical protein [Amphibacillus jilinensis]|nr:hypothetical protein [Amphibacillus jilinensis]
MTEENKSYQMTEGLAKQLLNKSNIYLTEEGRKILEKMANKKER